MSPRSGPALVLALLASPAAAAEDAVPGVPELGRDGLTFLSRDGRLDLKLGGRVFTDAGGGEARGASVDHPSVRDARVTAARLELTILYDRWRLAAQASPVDRTSPVKDLALAYAGFGPVLLTVGNVKEPFSFEVLQSSNVTTFTERGLPTGLAPGRAFGAVAGAHGERWTLAAGVFGADVNRDLDRAGTAVTARATLAPVLAGEGRGLVHLGVAGSHRTAGRDDFAVNPAPESGIVTESLIGGAVRAPGAVSRLGLEAAAQHGPVRFQGEYLLARTERAGPGLAGPSGTFRGGYLQLAWTVTGEHRPYATDPAYGSGYAVFGGVTPAPEHRLVRGGYGAFEVAARVSTLDLDGRGLRGGRERNVTAGVNWYPDVNVRLMLNYVRAFADRPRGEPGRADAHVGQARFQVAF